MRASDMLFDSRGWVFRVKLSDEDIADFEVLRNVAMATIFGFLYMGSHWRHLANTTKQSTCGADAALCQITLTTCYYYRTSMDTGDDASLEIVDMFCYMGDMLSVDGDADAAVEARVCKG